MTTFAIAFLTGIITAAIGFIFGIFMASKAIAEGKVENVKVIK